MRAPASRRRWNSARTSFGPRGDGSTLGMMAVARTSGAEGPRPLVTVRREERFAATETSRRMISAHRVHELDEAALAQCCDHAALHFLDRVAAKRFGGDAHGIVVARAPHELLD